MVSADGFRLAVVTLNYDGEGEVLIFRDDLWGTANALRKAHRVNLSFETGKLRASLSFLFLKTNHP